jgi:hypothetical protein
MFAPVKGATNDGPILQPRRASGGADHVVASRIVSKDVSIVPRKTDLARILKIRGGSRYRHIVVKTHKFGTPITTATPITRSTPSAHPLMASRSSGVLVTNALQMVGNVSEISILVEPFSEGENYRYPKR